jgi:hypothetical protein
LTSSLTFPPDAAVTADRQPREVGSLEEALQDAVDAAIHIFRIQFDTALVPDGDPRDPDPLEVACGSTLALTNEFTKYQFAFTYSAPAALRLTRALFAEAIENHAPMADIDDALNELPNMAAGVWKARRDRVHGETYQLGLPMFMRGSSWIRYFPKGTKAIAQKLTGPGEFSLQVILVGQVGEKAGGKHPMTNSAPLAAPPRSATVPVEVLKEAVRAVVKTCGVQMDLPLEVDPNPSDPRDADVRFGSNIALTAVGGGWQLAVMGNKSSCEALTRNLFAMGDGETPEMDDMADALGEIANVAAGVLKASRQVAGQDVQLGLPLFLTNKSCVEFFADGVEGMAQTLRGAGGLEVHVILIWQEV